MISKEFVEDRVREVAHQMLTEVEGVVESAAYDAGVAEPDQIVEAVSWWWESEVAGKFIRGLIEEERNA